MCGQDLSSAAENRTKRAKESTMFTSLINRCDRAPERGATVVEYALLAALISAVIVVAVTRFGQAVVALFTSVPPF
jgi:Flp pilus assembly pilin Flp